MNAQPLQPMFAGFGSASANARQTTKIPDPVLPEPRPTLDTATQVSSDVAEHIIQKFYPAISAGRDTVASFYVPASIDEGQQVPRISFNGNIYADGEAFQKMVTEIEVLNFDIESVDCAPLNPVYAPDGNPGSAVVKGKHMTVFVTVAGAVKLGDPENDDNRGFSDSLILVPNREHEAMKKKGKPSREWLVQNHSFRFVS